MLAIVLNPFARMLAAGKGIVNLVSGTNDLRQFIGQFIGPSGLSKESFGSGSSDVAQAFRTANAMPQQARAPTPSSR